MTVFSIIVFGLATVRTLTKMYFTDENEEGNLMLPRLIVAITMCWCYVWFLGEVIN